MPACQMGGLQLLGRLGLVRLLEMTVAIMVLSLPSGTSTGGEMAHIPGGSSNSSAPSKAQGRLHGPGGRLPLGAGASLDGLRLRNLWRLVGMPSSSRKKMQLLPVMPSVAMAIEAALKMICGTR